MVPIRTCQNRALRPWKRGESRMLWWCRCSRMQLKPARTFPEAPGQHGSNIMFCFLKKKVSTVWCCWYAGPWQTLLSEVAVASLLYEIMYQWLLDAVHEIIWVCSSLHESWIKFDLMSIGSEGNEINGEVYSLVFVNNTSFELSGVLTVHKVNRNLKGLWCHGILNHLWWCWWVCNHVRPAITSQVKWRHMKSLK